MAINFSAQFIVNEKTSTRVLRLTDTSTGFTLSKGNFIITFPDGTQVANTDFANPQITAPGGNTSISLITDVDNTVLTGTYVITYVALNTSLNEFTKTETFDFNWEKPAKAIINDSDVVLPEVQFKDLTAYETSGSFAGTLTRNFYTTTPSTSEVGVITKTSVGDILTPVNASKYYEGIYLVKSDISVAYTHTSKSWLTIAYTDLLEETFDVREAPTQDELVALMNTYKDQIEAYKSTNPSQYEIMNEQYDLVLALYSHIIARYQTSTLDGSKAILDQLLGLLPPASSYTYKATQMLPFTINFSTSLTGTGTTGTLPKFTGTTTLGDSIIRESGGMIGIAKAPTAVLDVSGTIKGTSIVKDGGTSTQFLKADGSVDANSYQPLDGDLTAIAALAGTSGLVRKTAANTYELDSSAYLTGINSGQITTALGYTPENAANKGVNNGYAGLDGSGKVPSTQLPSYVDDVLEYANLASLPVTGETGKIYVTLDTNKIYRWTGSVYVEVSPTVGVVWGAISGTLANQTDLQAALNAKQATLTLTTTGTGGPATLLGATLNIPQYEGGYSSQLKHQVKLGATIAKGKAVYVSSADGTNMIVSVASNASESTSSKTLGLLETGGATNAIVNVVTEGLLAGLDTSTALAGDPVWLGTSGNLIFGLTNKPVAPAHLVFIGIVTRVQQNNGEIFVKVQNGFELNELHDVLVGSYGTNDVLYRDTTTNLWKNASIATVLGYTPANDSAVVKLTGNQTIAGVKTFTSPLLANSPSGGATGEGLIVGQSFKIDGSGSSQAAVMYMVSNALSDTYGSGLTVQFANLAGDKAAGFNLNTAGGFELYVKNTIFGKALAITNTMAATFGSSVTATSFIKSGGSSAEFLKADGSVDANTYVSATQLALKADIANPVFTDNIYISGTNPRLYFTDTDTNPDYTIFVDSGVFYILNQTTGEARLSIAETGNISAGVGKSMVASSFIRRGGTSEQFLMADGSVSEGASFTYPGIGIAVSGGGGWLTSIDDNSSNWNAAYSARISSLTTTGNSGAATLASNVLNIPTYTIAGLGGQPAFAPGTGFVKISGTTISYDNNTYLPLTGGTLSNSLNSNWILTVTNTGTTDAHGLYVNLGSSSTGVPFRVDKGSSPLFNIANNGVATFSSDVTAASFIRTGGTSAGFLKADGSVDIRDYAFASSLANYLPLTGGTIENTLSSGYVLSVKNNGTAADSNGLYVNIDTASTGTPFKVARGGVSLINVNYLGATVLKSTITAISFIKSSGTSSEYLMADGSVSTGPSFTYPGAGIAVSTGSAWGTSITDNSSNWNTAFSWGNHAGVYLPLSGGTLTGPLGGTSASFSGAVTSSEYKINNLSALLHISVYTVIKDKAGLNSIVIGDTNDPVTYYDNSQHYFRNRSGSPKVVINQNGNVLIGTTTDIASVFKLQVGNGTADSRVFFNPNTPYAIGLGNGASSNWYIGVNTATTANGLQFYANELGAAAMTVTTTGRLGIGTPSPTELLEVKAANPIISINQTTQSNNSGIRFKTNDTQIGTITAQGGAGNMDINMGVSAGWGGFINFQTDTTTKMRITSAGNVGIGTETPSSRLSVQAPSNTTSNMDFFSGNNIKGHIGMFSNNFYITSNWFYNGTQNADSLSYGQAAITFDTGTTNGSISFATSVAGSTAPAERLKVTSGGEILINGTYNPYPISTRGNITLNGTGSNIIAFTNNSTPKGYIYHDNTDLEILNVSGMIRFYAANAERMRIMNGGIVRVTGTSSIFNFGQLDANNIYFQGYSLDSTTPKGFVWYGLGEYMRITTVGNLLIGAPALDNGYKLQVNGSVSASAYYELSDLRLKNITKKYDSDEFGAIEFGWIDGRDSKNHWGYVAQEVQQYLPDAVNMGNDGFLTVDYNQAHTFKIAKVEDEVTLLKRRVEELEKQLNLN